VQRADLGADSSELEFGRVAASLDEETLLALLDERHHAYERRSESAAARMRGWVLCCLASRRSRHPRLLPFLREELETGTHAYPVAAAAAALRAMAITSPDWERWVESALRRARLHDDALQLDRYPLDWTAKRDTTAVSELQKTLAALRDPAADPAALLPVAPPGIPRTPGSVRAFELEDHSGNRISFGEYLSGRPSFLVFFYTRCNNPNKCSANVARWGVLQHRLAQEALLEQVNLAAITYDPAFDTPPRLAAYARERNVALGDRARMFRVTEHFPEFQQQLALHVNYSQTTINRHASEAMVFDRSLAIVEDYVRTTWQVEDVIRHLRTLLQ
jgi:protein SCO1/2